MGYLKPDFEAGKAVGESTRPIAAWRAAARLIQVDAGNAWVPYDEMRQN